MTTMVRPWIGELGEPVLQELLQVLDVARHAAHDARPPSRR